MQFDNKISIGNLLTVLALIIGMIAGYSDLQAAQQSQEEKLTVFALEDKEREARLRVVEIAQAGVSSDLRSIQSGILEIKAALVELKSE